MTWRGTLILLMAGIAAAALLLITTRTRTRPAEAPLLGIISGETTGMMITGTGSSTVMENREGVWWITHPLVDRADPAKVGKILGAASDVVPLDKLRPSDLKGSLSLEALDLKPVKRSLTFLGNGNHTLRIGSEGAVPDRVYAQVDSDPSVYLISSEVLSLAFQPLNDLRDSSPLPSRPDQLCSLVLQLQGGSRELALRRKGKDWTIDSPLHARADIKAVGILISQIFGSKILRWMPAETEPSACGLDAPEAVLTVREQTGEPARLELGKAVMESQGARYARASGRPGIFVLGGTDPWLASTPGSLRLRNPSTVELDSIDRILISRGGQTEMLSRRPRSEEWLCRGRTIPGTALKDWHARLQGLTANAFEAATPDHLASREIDPPTQSTVSIRFVARLSENTAEESAGEMTLAEWTIGTPAADGSIAIREGKSDDLMIFPASTVTPLLEEALGWMAAQPSQDPSPIAAPTTSPAIP